MRDFTDILTQRGFTPAEAQAKSRLFADATRALAPSSTPLAFFVPGRIEFLGKHTDYAGGRSIVAAVQRGFCVVAQPRPDNVMRILDVVRNTHTTFALSPDLQPPVGDWSNYPMTVARRVARNFPGPLTGLDLAFVSDLPPAAGMSSSSAFMIACFLAISSINRLPNRAEYQSNIKSNEDLAGYLATIENGQSFGTLTGDKGVGTFGGSEDHTAILCCRPGHLSQYSYCPVRLERTIRLPPGLTFTIASSAVISEKTGQAMEAYNRASRLASAVLEHWRTATGRNDPHLAAAIQSSPDAPAKMRAILKTAPDPSLCDRFEHFLIESNQLIPAAADALETNNLSGLSPIIDRSQHLAETLLKNQVPETIHLAHSARALGAIASSAFGAGFGGSVWALIETSKIDPFLASWQTDYHRAFPTRQGSFFATAPAPAAFAL